MHKHDATPVLKFLALIKIELSEGKVTAAMKYAEEARLLVEKEAGIEDDMERITLGIPVCICEDGKGWSTCGGNCLVHRPSYPCTCGGCGECTLKGDSRFCSKKVAYMKMCYRCDRGVK